MKRLVSSAGVIELLKAGGVLQNLQLSETFVLPLTAEKLHFENCSFKLLSADFETYDYPISFKDCEFEQIFCMAGWFLKGFRLEDCQVRGETDFNCGVHNKPPHEFRIENCIFQEFVSFSDCVFEGPVSIIGNQFLKGTDLLGDKGTPVEVWFDVPPVIEGNSGELDVSSYRTLWD